LLSASNVWRNGKSVSWLQPSHFDRDNLHFLQVIVDAETQKHQSPSGFKQTTST